MLALRQSAVNKQKQLKYRGSTLCQPTSTAVYSNVQPIWLSLSYQHASKPPSSFLYPRKQDQPACMTVTQWHITSVVMKCFEQLVMDHICSSLPSTLNPPQLVYCPNRSTEDSIADTFCVLCEIALHRLQLCIKRHSSFQAGRW